MTETEVYKLIANKYGRPAWVTNRNVADGTGFNIKRYADAISVGIWPSRGYEVHGFEIKCNRGDWKTEVENIHKSSAIQKYCDRWWIVAPSNIIKRDEVPLAWGLLTTSEGKPLREIKPAPLLPSEPISKEFLAAIVRRNDSALEDEYNRGYSKAALSVKKEKIDSAPAEIKSLKERAERAEKAIEDFQKQSGIKIHHWNAGDVGKIVKILETITDKYSNWKGIKNIINAVGVCKEKMNIFCKDMDEELKKIMIKIE